MRILFKKIDEKYADFLRKYDKRVPYVNDDKQNRPFIGCEIQLSGITYYIPLSSPKAKHKKMKNTRDFHKINNGIYGAINFNNMIPVEEKYLYDINMNITPNDNEQTVKYKNLLNNQLSWCNKTDNKNTIINKANNLYKSITLGTADESLKKRCCDFSLLESIYTNFK